MNLKDLYLRIQNALVNKNIDSHAAANIAKDVTDKIEDECGGLTLYISKKRIANANLKREQIISEFNGRNQKILAKKHNISIVHIYRLLKEHKTKNMEPIA